MPVLKKKTKLLHLCWFFCLTQINKLINYNGGKEVLTFIKVTFDWSV